MATWSGTRIQLSYQHFPDGFWWSAAWRISRPVKIWNYAKITQTQIVYCKTVGVPRMGPGKRVTVVQVASRYSVLQLPEDLGTPDWTLDSPGWGCSRFYIASTWRIRWRVTVCAIYRKFGMTSRPGQQLLAVSLWWLLYRSIVAIPQLSEGCNQGPVGLDYRYTRYAGAQRSGFPKHRYTCRTTRPQCLHW